MYDGRFIKAKDFQGKFYRNEHSGDLINYCHHDYQIYPIFGRGEEFFAGFIPEEKREFVKFIGVCLYCGEVITIHRDSIFENEEKLEESLKERLEEINKEESKKKK